MRRYDIERLNQISAGCADAVPAFDLSAVACLRVAGDPAQAGIWVVPMGGEPRPVALRRDMGQIPGTESPPTLSGPRWSPDGVWLAFATHEGMPPGEHYRLWAVRADGSDVPRVLHSSVGVIAGYRWSPSGAFIAVADSEAGLLIIRRESGKAITVDVQAMRYPLGENAMAWIGDDIMVYNRLAEGRSGLWVVELGTGNQRLLWETESDEIVLPGWSGAQIWGALRGNLRDPAQRVALMVWRGADAAPEVYTLPNAEFDPAAKLIPTSDGALWAFTVWREGQRVPWVVGVPGGKACEIECPYSLDCLVSWLEEPHSLLASLGMGHFVGLDIPSVAVSGLISRG